MKTDFAKAEWSDKSLLKATLKQAPLRMIGEPVDIAGTAILLASSAGRFITGQTLVVDGGVTIAGRGWARCEPLLSGTMPTTAN